MEGVGISDLIERLKEIKEDKGDIEVYVEFLPLNLDSVYAMEYEAENGKTKFIVNLG